MKQISLALNIILIATVFYLGCTKSKQSPNNNNSTVNVVDTGLTDEPHCMTCSQPFDGVLAKDFIRVVARYRKTHWDIINADVNIASRLSPNTEDEQGKPLFEDSRCVWFSLDTLKKFICFIERYSDALHISRDSLGIRFYYAVYPGMQTEDFSTADYGTRFGQHTLYMVPTKQFNTETVDFDPRLSYQNKVIPNSIPVSPSDSGIVYLSKFLYDSSHWNTQIMVFPPLHRPGAITNGFSWNNGKLCPTNCPSLLNNTLNVVDNAYIRGLDYKQNW